MTTEEINVSIARKLGIKCFETVTFQEADKMFLMEQEQRFPKYVIPRCRDYANDLNAMHEAENWLTEHFQNIPEHETEPHVEYSLILLRSVATWKKEGFDWGDVCDADFFKIAHATSHQRAEAFLRVFNLWKNDHDPQRKAKQ